MPATAAEMVPTLSTKMVAGEPLVAGETVRLSESSAAVLNKYRKLYSADEAFGEAAREDARRRFVAAFALITARSTGGFEHRADAPPFPLALRSCLERVACVGGEAALQLGDFARHFLALMDRFA